MSEYEGRLIVLDEAFGKNAIGKEFHPRKRERPQPYLHCTSAREAILAHLPDYRVAQILEDHGLVRYTPSMITDETELVAALENVRDRGFALNDQEHIQGIRAVGAPIRYNGEIVVSRGLRATGMANSSAKNYPRRSRVANAIEVNLHSNLDTGKQPLI